MTNRSSTILFKYIIFFFIIICIVLNSGYALSVGNNKLSAISLAALTGSLFFIFYLKKHKFNPRNKSEKVVIALLLSILVAFLINFDFSSFLEYARYIMFIMSGYFLAKLITLEQFVYYFSRIMRFFTVVSLIMFFAIRLGIFELPTATNGYGVSYYNGWIFLTQTLANMRNSAIFWEPGLYAGFLALALSLEISFVSKNEKNFKYIIFYITAMITTQSTTGYLYLILIFILMISNHAKGFKQSLIFVTVVLAVFYAYWNFGSILNHLVAYNPQVFIKLQTQNSSYLDRILNPIIDLMIFLQYPLGCGIGKLTPLVQNFSSNLATMVHTRTSTLTFFFATFGLIGGLAFNIAWLVGFIKNSGLNIIRKITIIILFISVASSSPLMSNMSIWIMIFVLYESTNKKSKI